jgi:DNA modification methylase
MSKVIAQAQGDGWMLYQADCVDVLRGLPANSINFSCFSPPYSQLYTYSSSNRDMGNTRSTAEFFLGFTYCVKELMRVMKPGRIVAVDCMNLPLMKERDGYIGLDDFRGRIIRKFKGMGFIFHSEHCLWKDPLIEATRTKSIGLMHKQLKKDSAMCRAGLPQYLVAFRKPGINAEPIRHESGLDYFVGINPPKNGNLSHERWRRYASPIWDDIDFGNTLNARAARDNDDERHICPLSLDIIHRALWLWSNPGDTVLSPFAGIGSEGFVALQEGRQFVGVELKESYFTQACGNLRNATKQTAGLFAEKAEVEA